MKKTVSLILALLLVCATLFSLTACGGQAQDTDKAVAEATAPLKAQIEALEKEISSAEARIAELEAENATLKSEKASLTDENATLKAKVAELEAKIAELEAEITRLKAALDGDTATLTAEIERLEAEVKTLKDEKTTLTARITELEANITEKDTEIATLNSTVSALTNEKNTLTARVAELEAKITELEATITAKNNEIDALNSTVSTLTAEKNALTARVAELESENEELEALVAALRNCLKGMHTYSGGICIYCEAEQGDVTYVRCDKDGTENAEGEYLLFGEYPQTIKADDVTITETQDSRGYYLGSDGSYYAMVTASPCGSSYTFSTGSTVASGSVYYFKVEPIRWRILSEENGEALILCDSIIANIAYQPDYTYDSSTGLYYTTANGAPEGTYANNYKYSNVRNWLNSTFYETAFSSLESSLILTTEVDNSAASLYNYGYTGTPSDTYACENTSDKVFLLSQSEATNTNYSFASSGTSDTARRMLTSDYSRATGAFMDTSSSYYGNGWWWLRSPCYLFSNYARDVDSDGYADNIDDVYLAYGGVAPALRIRL